MSINISLHGSVALVKIERREALNALDSKMLDSLVGELSVLEKNREIGCFVITGYDHVFAAGADIKEMATHNFSAMNENDYFSGWRAFAELRTPKIAAVNGLAFGGGCELAMMCDIIYASRKATFGQPEIRLGVMPGMGGTQRLTHLLGKSKAMDMILTGTSISGEEAEKCGLAARVFDADQLIDKAMEAATKIGAFSRHAVRAAREAVCYAEELPLSQGLVFERRLFHALFATEDQAEGMQAFMEKRQANFNRR